jgi:hypothetical protein
MGNNPHISAAGVTLRSSYHHLQTLNLAIIPTRESLSQQGKKLVSQRLVYHYGAHTISTEGGPGRHYQRESRLYNRDKTWYLSG